MKIVTILVLMFCLIPAVCAANEINNPAEPLKGEVELTLKKTMEINPENFLEVDPGMFFTHYQRNDSGDFYLINGKSVTVYKFTKQGKFVKSFLRKGEGPGEFDIYPRLRPIGDQLLIYREQKWGLFNLDGKLLKDGRLKKFYYEIITVDPGRFIAYNISQTDPGNGRSGIKKSISMVDLHSSKPAVIFIETPQAGRLAVPGPKKSSFSVNPPHGIVPDVIYDYDTRNKCVVYTLNHEYKIYKKDLQGKLVQVILKKTGGNPALGEEDKQKIVKRFGDIPEDLKKGILKRLPDKMCAIGSIRSLPNDWIWVNQILGYERFGIDIFDENGRYLYRLKLPKDIALTKMRIYDNSILVGINEEEDNNVLVIYSISNAAKIFN